MTEKARRAKGEGSIPDRLKTRGQRMTLTEFLTARITEDEQPTWRLVPYDCAPDCCAPAGWVGSQCRYCDATPIYGGTMVAMRESAEEHAENIHQRPRVLAECAAKRQIVSYCEAHTPLDDRNSNGSHGISVLLMLALPYSGHSDYQDEWRI